jgi:hypothetical protein
MRNARERETIRRREWSRAFKAGRETQDMRTGSNRKQAHLSAPGTVHLSRQCPRAVHRGDPTACIYSRRGSNFLKNLNQVSLYRMHHAYIPLKQWMLQQQRDVAHEQLQPEALNIFHRTLPNLLMSSLVFLCLFLLPV